jgi:RNA polymerase sigma-70 factor (ECF subfamily)
MSGDAALLDRLRQGKPEAWQALIDMFRQRLRDLAASSLPAEVACRADASDVVQQTLAEANESFTAFRGNSLPELYEWLASILRHNVSDVVRWHMLAERRTVKAECRLDDSSRGGARWDGVCAADQTSPSIAAARDEAYEQLCVAIEALPVRQRAAVRLRHLEGRPLADIAIELSCSPQAAAAIIARGLRSLRAALHDID